ncbi:MAG TPA: pyridoxal phosphate-dependent aminotransferase [Thermoanaerobaculia bacterium]|nr:pyridoxal phosphate-dependent aminotransferase [Thermoanaerobaculia bacterium]
MTQIADRLKGLVQSDIRRMSRDCERVGGINLGQGICDLPTLPIVAEGAIEAIRANKATYSKFEGIDLLRQKIAAKISRFNRFEVNPDDEIVVSVGSTGGFAAAAMATLNPGDEVILFEPFYGYHLNTLKILGVNVKFVPLQAPDWTIDFDRLRAAFTPRTRGIVVCTPSNPCGKVFSVEEMERIGALCREFSAWAYTDEIYEYIVYDGRAHRSMASLESCRDLTITVSGFSKTFSITGWRIGYVAAPAPIARAIGLVNDLFYVCAPTPLQWGVARALDIEDSYYRELAESYQEKRDLLAEALRFAGIEPLIPQGAYYMLADVSSLGFTNGKEAADRLLADAGVASIPGSAFFAGGGGDQLLRFCFAKDLPALAEASNRLRSYRSVAAK